MRSIFKRVIRLVAFLVGSALFIGLAAVGGVMYCNAPPPFSPDSVSGEGIALESAGADSIVVRFEVRRGESARSVGQRLAESGIIRNRYFWSLLCRYNKEPIKTGSYRIELPASQIAVHNILVSGKQILMKVTVPEGLTIKKTARLMEEAGICTAEAFIEAASDPDIIERYRIPNASMEGYLYPDTYLFPPEFPATRVIQTMADTFFIRIGEIDERALSMPADELNRLVILASIIEREYQLGEEAPVMAGVFYNRMNIGMALQSCA
ncbi:MAG: endolytic transglycosylase MltG, partial [Treponema sp.]|nr:endolytic transglycosylase MltG [Treponema sp.]